MRAGCPGLAGRTGVSARKPCPQYGASALATTLLPFERDFREEADAGQAGGGRAGGR